MKVTKADNPQLFQKLRQAGYRKHSVTVNVADKASLTQPYWSGGSKSQHYMLFLNTGKLNPLQVAHNPYPQPPAETEVSTAPGMAIVTGGTFRGKPAHWRIVMHIDDAREFFPGV